MDREKADTDGRDKAKIVVGKGNRYKDKFHNLRIRYDAVISKHEDYRRELEVANIKLKKLQAENDLLLDAMGIAAPGQPTLLQYLLPPPPLQDHPREANGHVHSIPHDHVNGDAARRPPENDVPHPEYTTQPNGRAA